MAIDPVEQAKPAVELRGGAREVQRVEQVAQSEFGRTTQTMLNSEFWSIANPGGKPRTPENKLTSQEGTFALHHAITADKNPEIPRLAGVPLIIDMDLPVTGKDGSEQQQHYEGLTIVAVKGGDAQTVNCIFQDEQGNPVQGNIDRGLLAGMILLSERPLVESRFTGPEADLMKKYLDEIDPTVQKPDDFQMTPELTALSEQVADGRGMFTTGVVRGFVEQVYPDVSTRSPEFTQLLDDLNGRTLLTPEDRQRFWNAAGGRDVVTGHVSAQLDTAVNAAQELGVRLEREKQLNGEGSEGYKALKEQYDAKQAEIALLRQTSKALAPGENGVPSQVEQMFERFQNGDYNPEVAKPVFDGIRRGDFAPFFQLLATSENLDPAVKKAIEKDRAGIIKVVAGFGFGVPLAILLAIAAAAALATVGTSGALVNTYSKQ